MRCNALLLVLTFALGCGSGSGTDLVLRPGGTLGPLLVDTVTTSGVPAIGAYAFNAEGMEGSGVAGVRRNDADVQVTLADRWHLGSNTKAMTAVLAARLDALEIISLDTPLLEAFPDRAVDAGYAAVTLADLLMHRGGAPESGLALYPSVVDAGDLVAQRAALVAEVVEDPPAVPPGTYAYSNVGYVLVAAALEAATGGSWETLMAEHVFEPLEMSSCGFGPPDVDADLSQPWGHFGGEPVPPGPDGDNLALLGPAGTVHCTLEDWGKFAIDQLRGAQGREALLPEDAYRRLHTPPPDGDYALGWGVLPAEDGFLLTHTGSNTNFTSIASLLPQEDRGLLVVANRGDDGETFRAFEEVTTSVLAALREE